MCEAYEEILHIFKNTDKYIIILCSHFCYPWLWNAFPEALKLVTNPSTFKINVIKHLISQYCMSLKRILNVRPLLIIPKSNYKIINRLFSYPLYEIVLIWTNYLKSIQFRKRIYIYDWISLFLFCILPLLIDEIGNLFVF